jgi:hypothetical protein
VRNWCFNNKSLIASRLNLIFDKFCILIFLIYYCWISKQNALVSSFQNEVKMKLLRWSN